MTDCDFLDRTDADFHLRMRVAVACVSFGIGFWIAVVAIIHRLIAS